ncbi:MAG: DivIVA domain-containing protein [Nocardioidaceae bacterium]
MIWVWVLVIIVVVGVVVVVAVGRDEALVEVYDDRPDTTIPVGRFLTAEDLRDVRLNTAVRGYRMDEVDSLLRRLQNDLRAREQQNAEEPSSNGDEDAGSATAAPLSP